MSEANVRSALNFIPLAPPLEIVYVQPSPCGFGFTPEVNSVLLINYKTLLCKREETVSFPLSTPRDFLPFP